MDFEYDVTLSFAGEDREYVGQVADILNAIGLKVFYDKYEEVNLWGKDLYTHLDKVYQHKSKYRCLSSKLSYLIKNFFEYYRPNITIKSFAG